MRRMRGMLKIASRLATRLVLLVIFTSRNRCGRWRKSGADILALEQETDGMLVDILEKPL